MPLELLKLERSAQSGDKALTGAYATVYEDTDDYPWIFATAEIDLTPMQAGDSIDIRLSAKNESGGAYVVMDEENYLNAQPADAKMISIDAFPNQYGVKIEARQTAGPLRTITMEFFVAKR